MLSPGVSPLGPFVTAASSGFAVAAALAAYPQHLLEFGQRVLYGCGPAQVGFGDFFSLIRS